MTSLLLGQRRISIQQLTFYDTTLPCIPPSPTYLPLTGKLTLIIHLDYLNLPFDKNFQYRYCLWGSQQKIYFNGFKSQLKITSSIESLSKYIWDMNILCIQVVSVIGQSDESAWSERKKLGKTQQDILEKEKKIAGYVLVPLRKYFINHVMSSFSNEKFAIVDQGKKRIGEMGIQLRIDLLPNNGLDYKQLITQQQTDRSYLNPPSKQRSQDQQSHSLLNQITNYRLTMAQNSQKQRRQKKVTISDRNEIITEQNNYMVNSPSQQQYRETEKNLVQKKYIKKNYFSHEDIYLGEEHQNTGNQSEKQSRQNQEDNKIERQNQNGRKYHEQRIRNTYSDIEEYLKKPEHNDLSMIKMKYGSTHPDIQLMKLRLDQVQYLQKDSLSHQFSQDQLTNQSDKIQLKFLLKQLVMLPSRASNLPPRTLSISSASHKDPHKILSRTEISLQNLPKRNQTSSILINNLMLINNLSSSSKLIIETPDAILEIAVKDLMKQEIVDLRRKDNRKRAYEVKYEVIFQEQKSVNGRDVAPSSVKKQQLSKSPFKKQKPILKKTKQINNIINNLSNTNQNTNYQKKPLQIIPEKQNGQRAPSQSVKSPYHKLLKQSPQNLFNPTQEQLSNEDLVAETVNYFSILYRCEDQRCFQIVNKLVKDDKGSIEANQKSRNYSKLQSILTDQENKSKPNKFSSLQTILTKLFNSSFSEFYQTFLSYKQINQRYQTTLYKLSKVLSFPQQQPSHRLSTSPLSQLYGIIQYIKKYKKQLINFGLIDRKDLLEVLRQKLLNENNEQEENQSKKGQPDFDEKEENAQNNKQKEVEQFVESLLILFSRYQNDFIKISQLQGFIQTTLKYGKHNNKKDSESLKMNLNVNLLKNLYREVLTSCQNISQNPFINSKIFIFINNYLRDLIKLSQQQEKLQTRITLYNLLYCDVLSLSQLKSSIHFSLINSEHLTSRINTQQTQPYHKRVMTQQEQQLNHIRNMSQKIDGNQRINTEEIELNQKKRLNTEDMHVIDIVNNNQQAKKFKEEEVIGIEITKREDFRPQTISPAQKEDQKSQKQQLEESSRIKSQLLHNKPSSNYISIKCSLINPNSYGINPHKINKLSNIDPIQSIVIFYLYQNDKNNQAKEYKIDVKSKGSLQTIVPNSFSDELTFKLQNVLSQGKNLQVIQSMGLKNTILVKNLIGKQQYPIENQFGQVYILLQVEIQPLDQNDQQKFLEQQKIIEQNLSKELQSDKFNRLFIMNVNQLFSLDLMEESRSVRVIYERDNQIIGVRDVELTDRDVQNEEDQDTETVSRSSRVLSINTQFINIKTSSIKHQKHIIKIFKLKQQTHISSQTEHIPHNKTHNQSLNPIKSKHSQPINRQIEHKQQTNLISLQNKSPACDLLVQFQFTIDLNPRKNDIFGIRKETKWLINDKYRVQVDLFDVKYEKWEVDDEKNIKSNENEDIWNKKILKILNVLSHSNLSNIKQRYQLFYEDKASKEKLTVNSLLEMVSQAMSYRLTQRQIFASLCFIKQQQDLERQSLSSPLELKENQKLSYLLHLFDLESQNPLDLAKCDRKSSIQNLVTLYEEFQTFDLQHTGSLTPFKYEVLKKVIPELNLLETHRFLLGNSQTLQLQNYPQKQAMTDQKVSKQIRSNIDYLRILWVVKDHYKDDFFLFQQRQMNDKKQSENKLPKKEQVIPNPKEKILEKNKQNKNLGLSWQNEHQELSYRKPQNQIKKAPTKQIDSLLKRQFYEQEEEQQSEDEQKYQRKEQFIGQSVLSALNQQSRHKPIPFTQNKLKASRQQSLLSQTRQEWQKMKNISLNNNDEREREDNSRALVNVLKEQIDKDEIEKKFTAIKHMDFSDSDSSDDD